MAEIADWPGTSALLCAPQRDLYRLPVLSIRSDGNKRGRPPRKNNDNGITPKGHENKTPKVSDGESSGSSNQEEIIALFKRIQTSISKGESISSKKRSSDSSKGKKSAEAVLDVLRLSGKQVKGSFSDNSSYKKIFNRVKVDVMLHWDGNDTTCQPDTVKRFGLGLNGLASLTVY